MSDFITNVQSDTIYTVSDILIALGDLCDCPVVYKKHKNQETGKMESIAYYNVPCSFDTEATSFKLAKKKYAWIYSWQFGINGYCFVGRTKEELLQFINVLIEFFALNPNLRLVVYVHNLSYDFQFIRKWFKWTNVFAIDQRKICKAVTENGLEFRCSYILSGYSLEMLSTQLKSAKCDKLKSKFDYNKIRHQDTVLTDTELKYMTNDIKIIMIYIYDKLQNGETIASILSTKTSYVRKYVRDHTIGIRGPIGKKYRNLVSELTMWSDEYLSACRAFSGGFTHANPKWVDKTMRDVHSQDFTSSYPFCMCCLDVFPMTEGQLIETPTDGEFHKYTARPFVSIFDITFTGLRLRTDVPDAIISKSKVRNPETGKEIDDWDCLANNGRIIMVDIPCTTTITSIDYESIIKFYEWDSITITNLWYYKANYLPANYIRCVLDFYRKKTEYKNKEGDKEHTEEWYKTIYQWAKENTNSTYGMMVTAIIRALIDYDAESEYNITPISKMSVDDLCKSIDNYNNSKTRFLSYLWGVFVTAAARRNLYTAIIEMGDDYIYSDTDSVKYINHNKHTEYFDRYNAWVDNCYSLVMKHYKKEGFTYDDFAPCDVKGERHPLGYWDWETQKNPYKRFKTLGAKRYLVEQSDGYHMTVAGCPKGSGHYVYDAEKDEDVEIPTIDYIIQKYTKINPDFDIFEWFATDAKVKPDEVVKLCHTYIDDECELTVTDYQGIPAHVKSESSVHMENIGFRFDRADEFSSFLLGYV